MFFRPQSHLNSGESPPVIYGWCFWDVKDAVQRAEAQTALGCQKWHSSALLRNSPSCAGAHRLRQSSQSASRTASSVPLFPGRLACKSLLPAVPLLRPPKQHFVEHQRVTRALYKVNTSSYTQTHSFTGDPSLGLVPQAMITSEQDEKADDNEDAAAGDFGGAAEFAPDAAASEDAGHDGNHRHQEDGGEVQAHFDDGATAH